MFSASRTRLKPSTEVRQLLYLDRIRLIINLLRLNQYQAPKTNRIRTNSTNRSPDKESESSATISKCPIPPTAKSRTRISSWSKQKPIFPPAEVSPATGIRNHLLTHKHNTGKSTTFTSTLSTTLTYCTHRFSNNDTSWPLFKSNLAAPPLHHSHTNMLLPSSRYTRTT